MQRILLGILVSFLTSLPCFAQNQNTCGINLFGVSNHEGGKNGKNEENYGLGLRCTLNKNVGLGFKPILEGDIIRNSQRGEAIVFGAGLNNDALFRVGSFSFGGGGVIAHISYENPKIKRTVQKWTPIVFVSATYNDWLSVNATPLPDHKAWLFSLTIKHVF